MRGDREPAALRLGLKRAVLGRDWDALSSGGLVLVPGAAGDQVRGRPARGWRAVEQVQKGGGQVVQGSGGVAGLGQGRQVERRRAVGLVRENWLLVQAARG